MNKLFVLMFGIVLLMGTISAFEFDNGKSYDEITKTVTIKNGCLLGICLGDDIAQIKLNTPLTYKVPQGYGKVAEFTLTSFQDYNNAFKELELYDKSKGNKKFVRNFDFKYRTYKDVVVDSYENVLVTTSNGTQYYEQQIVGSDIKQKEKWIKLTPSDFKKNDVLTIGIFTDVERNDYVEWIPNFFGVRIEEWATWTEDLNTNLSAYYRLNETSGTANDSVAGVNGTLSGTISQGLSGIINNSYWTDGANGKVTISSVYGIGRKSWSVSIWVNTSNTNQRGAFFELGSGNTGIAFGVGGTTMDNDGNDLIGLYNGLGWIDTNTPIGSQRWVHVVLVVDSSGNSGWWVNASNVFNDSSFSGGPNPPVTETQFGGSDSGADRFFQGTFDEVGIWNRTLTGAEIVQLYNDGVGITYDAGPFTTTPVVTLSSPVNEFNSTSSTIDFVGNSTSANGIVNVTLFIDGVLNETNSSGINNTLYNFSKVIADGSHNWTYTSCSSDACATATSRNFSIDTAFPIVTVSTPNSTLAFQEINTNLTVNWTVTDANIDTCVLEYEKVNTTVTCVDNTTNINITNLVNKSLIFYANDSFGNHNSTTVSWNYRLFLTNQTFTSSLPEGIASTFTVNITTNGTDITIGNLSYNDTENIGSISQNGNQFVITKSITAPSVSVDTNLLFFWNITQQDGIYYALDSQNQTVTNVKIDDCSVNTVVLYNFTIVDERLQTLISLPTENTTAQVDLELFNIGRTIQITNFSKKYTTINPFAVCFNTTLLSTETYVADVQIKYEGLIHEREFYHIQNSTITTSDFPTNITLYDLLNSSSQTFEITFKDSSFLPVKDALIQIQRKYIDEGLFRVVEIPKTDTNGQTLGHFVLDDIIYTILVVKNGATLGTFNNVRVVCQNPTLENCEIPLNAVTTTIQPEDFTSLDDFTFTLDFNKTSRVVESIFTIPSSSVADVLLNVTLYDSLGNTTVCSDTLTSSSGTLQCTVPISFGNTSVLVELLKDKVVQGKGIISLSSKPSDTFGANLVFISLFLYLTLIGVALTSNPLVMGFFLIIGAILGLSLNLVSGFGFIGAGATILWLIIAIIIVLIKGSRRV